MYRLKTASLREQFAKAPAWPAAEAVAKRLTGAGFKAFLAGGAVRDAILGRHLKDFDIATDARPEEIEAIFEKGAKTIAVGKAFGVIRVLLRGAEIEVATFRSDEGYVDGRRPSRVYFASPKEDAHRRDFTVNALFYDLARDQLMDFVGGLADLKARRLRTVGDPHERFSEDYLRPLRAIRFVSQLGFTIEHETLNAIVQLGNRVERVSGERKIDEFHKTLLGENRSEALRLLIRTGLFNVLWPESAYAQVQDDSRLSAILKTYDELVGEKDLSFLYAVWLKDEERLGAKVESLIASFRARKVPGVIERTARFLLESYAKLMDANAGELEKLRWLDRPEGLRAFDFARLQARREGRSMAVIDAVHERYLNLMDSSGHLPKPLINGNDLKVIGFSPGPQMGEVLRELYDLQLRGQFQTREQGLKLALTFKDSSPT